MKATKNNVQQQAEEFTFELTPRFVEGDKVEIATDKGWTDGVVERVELVNAPQYGFPPHYHYVVRYVPLWARNEQHGYRSGLTVCDGPAIRAL